MARGVLHGMKPKGVDDGPGEDIAVVSPDPSCGFGEKPHFFSKEHTPTLVLQMKDQHQHDDDRPLGGPDGNILGKSVIPEKCLKKMPDYKQGVNGQGKDIYAMQTPGVGQSAFLGFPDQKPKQALVCQVADPGTCAGDEIWVG